MSAFYWLTKREVIRFFRQKSRLIGTLLTPLVFWAALGGGISAAGAKGAAGADNFFQFFFPGVVLLSTFFTAIFSAMGLIADRNEGFLQGVWCAPISRLSILLSKCVGAALISCIQGFLLLLLAPVAGLELSVSVMGASLFLLFWGAACISTLSFFFSWLLNSSEGFHSIMNVIILPMWFLSGGVFPLPESQGVFYWLIKINPMSYTVTSMQEVMFKQEFSTLPTSFFVLGLFAVLMTLLSLRLMLSKPASR